MADGTVVDLGLWCFATNQKTGFHEHAVPFPTLEVGLALLEKQYVGFHVGDEVDAVAQFIQKVN
jgi:hypothetical protein